MPAWPPRGRPPERCGVGGASRDCCGTLNAPPKVRLSRPQTRIFARLSTGLPFCSCGSSTISAGSMRSLSQRGQHSHLLAHWAWKQWHWCSHLHL